jgi:hypothetical protein
MQKFVFRSALRPNQISFSHSQDPSRTSAAQYIALRSAILTPLSKPLSTSAWVWYPFAALGLDFMRGWPLVKSPALVAWPPAKSARRRAA